MAPIRLGFIGLSSKGWASISLAPPLFDPLLASSYSLTALCTSSEASATAAVAKYSELAGHPVKGYHGAQGFVDIANDPNVDMVAVAIKMPQHLNAVWPAIEAGKDIFIEWTVGSSFEETLKIAEAAKKKGVKILVGAQATQAVFLNKVKEFIEGGKIGRVLLGKITTASYFGSTMSESMAYTLDANNGADLLTIPIGHFLVALSHAVGDDEDGKPTDKIIRKTIHDQIALSGIVRGHNKNAGAVFATFQFRAGIPLDGERERGRTIFKWTIDGEYGTIEVQHSEEEGTAGGFIQMREKRVFLNGEEVKLELGEEDRLGNSGKAWLEFARGGRYVNIDDAVLVHRVLDAAQKSIAEGRKVVQLNKSMNGVSTLLFVWIALNLQQPFCTTFGMACFPISSICPQHDKLALHQEHGRDVKQLLKLSEVPSRVVGPKVLVTGRRTTGVLPAEGSTPQTDTF